MLTFDYWNASILIKPRLQNNTIYEDENLHYLKQFSLRPTYGMFPTRSTGSARQARLPIQDILVSSAPPAGTPGLHGSPPNTVRANPQKGIPRAAPARFLQGWSLECVVASTIVSYFQLKSSRGTYKDSAKVIEPLRLTVLKTSCALVFSTNELYQPSYLPRPCVGEAGFPLSIEGIKNSFQIFAAHPDSLNIVFDEFRPLKSVSFQEKCASHCR
ncbi:hypothetical protein STEG23_027162, partial [Scotinomys teguina]